jgi:hypothetical protein
MVLTMGIAVYALGIVLLLIAWLLFSLFDVALPGFLESLAHATEYIRFLLFIVRSCSTCAAWCDSEELF